MRRRNKSKSVRQNKDGNNRGKQVEKDTEEKVPERNIGKNTFDVDTQQNMITSMVSKALETLLPTIITLVRKEFKSVLESTSQPVTVENTEDLDANVLRQVRKAIQIGFESFMDEDTRERAKRTHQDRELEEKTYQEEEVEKEKASPLQQTKISFSSTDESVTRKKKKKKQTKASTRKSSSSTQAGCRN